MTPLIDIGLKILLAGGVGYFLRARGVISEQLVKELGGLLTTVFVPFAIISAANEPFSRELVTSLGTTAGLTLGLILFSILVAWLISKTLPVDQATKHAFVVLVTFPNNMFVGLPFALELFGTPGLLCTIAATLVFNLFFFTFGEGYMARGANFSPWKQLRSPVVLASVAAVIIFTAQIPIPAQLDNAMGMIGAAMAPVAMMIVGFGLADSDLKDLVKNPFGFLVSGLRLIVLPLLVLVAARLLGLDAQGANVAVLIASLPSGTLTAVLAAKYGTAYQFTSQTVVQTNVLMFATVPLLNLLTQIWV
jgi:predicted permease